MPWPELYVLRHGQTIWNADGRHQGRKDSALTELGRQQAAAQGRILQRMGLADGQVDCFASPIGRAWSTAETALSAIGRKPVADERLVEVSFGAWEGLTRAEVDARWPENGIETDPFAWHFTSIDGERFEDLCERARQFLESLRRPSILVTHGITSRVLRGLWLGLDQAGMSALPGGQGVVYHLKDGQHSCLEDKM